MFSVVFITNKKPSSWSLHRNFNRGTDQLESIILTTSVHNKIQCIYEISVYMWQRRLKYFILNRVLLVGNILNFSRIVLSEQPQITLIYTIYGDFFKFKLKNRFLTSRKWCYITSFVIKIWKFRRYLSVNGVYGIDTKFWRTWCGNSVRFFVSDLLSIRSYRSNDGSPRPVDRNTNLYDKITYQKTKTWNRKQFWTILC